MDKAVFVRTLIDIDSLLKLKIETEEDIPKFQKALAASFSDYFLLCMIERVKREGHKELIKLYEAEAMKRGLLKK